YRDVDGLYFENLKDLLDAREQLQGRGVRTYESDVRPLERFLMERFINGNIEVVGEATTKNSYIQVEQTQARSAQEQKVPFSILSLDIETSMRGQLFSVGLHQVQHDGSGEEKSIVLMNGQP